MQTSVFEALSNRTRLKIIEYVKRYGKCGCCDIAKHIRKDVSTTFRHIEILSRAGVVSAERKGRFLICSLNNPEMLQKLFEIAKSIKKR